MVIFNMKTKLIYFNIKHNLSFGNKLDLAELSELINVTLSDDILGLVTLYPDQKDWIFDVKMQIVQTLKETYDSYVERQRYIPKQLDLLHSELTELYSEKNSMSKELKKISNKKSILKIKSLGKRKKKIESLNLCQAYLQRLANVKTFIADIRSEISKKTNYVIKKSLAQKDRMIKDDIFLSTIAAWDKALSDKRAVFDGKFSTLNKRMKKDNIKTILQMYIQLLITSIECENKARLESIKKMSSTLDPSKLDPEKIDIHSLKKIVSDENVELLSERKLQQLVEKYDLKDEDQIIKFASQISDHDFDLFVFASVIYGPLRVQRFLKTIPFKTFMHSKFNKHLNKSIKLESLGSDKYKSIQKSLRLQNYIYQNRVLIIKYLGLYFSDQLEKTRAAFDKKLDQKISRLGQIDERIELYKETFNTEKKALEEPDYELIRCSEEEKKLRSTRSENLNYILGKKTKIQAVLDEQSIGIEELLLNTYDKLISKLRNDVIKKEAFLHKNRFQVIDDTSNDVVGSTIINSNDVSEWADFIPGKLYLTENEQGIKVMFRITENIRDNLYDELKPKFLRSIKKVGVSLLNEPGIKKLKEPYNGKDYEVKIMGSGSRILGEIIEYNGQKIIEFNVINGHT